MSELIAAGPPLRRRGLSPRATVILTASTAALGGLLFGYDTSVISGAMLFFQHTFHLTTVQLEWAVSAVLLGAMAGSACGGRLTDLWGRRPVLLGTGVAFGVFSVWTGLSTGLATFVIARFFVGCCIGVASLVTPLYISEMSPANIRGALVSLNQLAITVGIGVAYIVDYALAGAKDWRMMFITAVIPAAVLVVGMVFLPESPRWLAKGGRPAEALANFRRLGREQEAQAELADVERVLREETGKFWDLFRPGFRTAVWIGIGLAILQQITGINTIIYYAPDILTHAGYNSAKAAILATAIIGIVNILTTVLAIFLVDRVGRKPLLIIGSAGMAASLFYVGYAFARHLTGLGVFIGVVVYIIFFAVSLGPVVWLMIAEIYPTKIRGAAMSLATCCEWGANFVVAVTFLSLLKAAGAADTFWIFAALSILGLLFCWLVIPETKSKSLEQIEEDFRRLGRRGARRSGVGF
ncbi:MAG: sugar porter family MFS transporter [Terriglobales bacterium]